MAVVVGPHHPLAHARRLRWDQLFSYPWAMPQRETLMRTRLDTVLLEHGAAGLRPAVETGSIVTMQAVLRETDYVGVCSAAMAEHLASLGLLHILPLGDRESFGPVGAVWRKGGDDEVLHAFMQALREQAGRIRAAEAGTAAR